MAHPLIATTTPNLRSCDANGTRTGYGLDILRATDELVYPFGYPRSSAVVAKCCTLYPSETGLRGELLPEMKRHVHIAMYVAHFVTFYREAWPVLISKGVNVTIVTGWDDQAAPWELLTCGVGALSDADVQKYRQTDGALVRRFLRSRHLVHWYTQNYDLLPHSGKRGWFKGSDRFECERISHR